VALTSSELDSIVYAKADNLWEKQLYPIIV